MSINVIDSHFHSFIKNVLPIAVDRNFGILAMKTLSDGRFFSEKKVLDKIVWESDDPVIPNSLSIKESAILLLLEMRFMSLNMPLY
jgi:uncharacterized protein